ncbi:MAG: PLP-dependent aminotransferase family protein [Emcibacteraceae bacterium]
MASLYFDLDRQSQTPLHRQLIGHLKNHMVSGDLKRGEKLPSSRTLARGLNISRIVTLTAYEQLIAEGYLVTKAGAGTFVSDNIITPGTDPVKDYKGPDWFNPSRISLPIDDDNKNNARFDFSIGHPASELFPKNNWRRAWRKALDHSQSNARSDRAGEKTLREEIAAFLLRTRNIKCHADNIIITSGAAETLRLLAKATAEFAPMTFVENPGFKIAWHWLDGGGELTAVNIDENGLITRDLPKNVGRPAMLFCTPSHQFPLGFRLSLKRRNDILKWATENDALILEDDYDSEFHYDTMPLPTLKAQDESGHVVYFSSFSKSISPNIKIGYLIAPEKIATVLKNIIAAEHAEPPQLMQIAMAAFIADGSLDKHIAKSRRHYTKLNRIMQQKLTELPAGVKISGLDSGIHAFMSFDKMPHKLIKKLEERSFYLSHQISTGGWHGFALGYGHFKENELSVALDELVAQIWKLYPEL